MSDIFNHELDAYESLGSGLEGDSTYGGPEGRRNCDPMHYHEKIYYDKLVSETDRAYLLSISPFPEPIWIARRLCKRLDRDKKSIFVHWNTFCDIRKIEREKLRFLKEFTNYNTSVTL